MTLAFLIFLNCICIGIVTGVLSDISYFFKKIFKNNYIINIVVDFIIFFIGATLVFILSVNINYNVFAMYEILGFVVGVILEKISCSNLFAKFFDMLYNGLVKLFNKLKLTKLGKVISK